MFQSSARALFMFALLSVSACGMSTVTIDGHAMSPTLKHGDAALITRSLGTLQRGDIVAFYYPRDQSKSFVKRIVGFPGDRISIADGFVAIDGKPLDEPYVIADNRSRDSMPTLTIPDGEYFMLGDNRVNSSDSRSWGTVPKALIWGKVMAR